MKAETGKYHFGRRFDYWSIRQWTLVTDKNIFSDHIKDVRTYEEAVTEVYRLNGCHTCKSTPLYVFIEITGGNLKAIRRRLFPSQKTMEVGSGMLQMEFANLCGENVKTFPQKRAIKLNMMIAQLSELLNIYSKSKDHKAKVWQKISEMTSAKDIGTAEKMLKSWQYQLKAEEDLLNKEAAKDKQSDTTFEDLVVEVEKHNKFQIDRRKTNVATFAKYVKSFKRYIASQEKQNRKKTGLR